MKAIMVMFDSLNRNYLEPYGSEFAKTPNFKRLAERSVQFNQCYVGSLPCIPARRELHTGRYNFMHRSWGPIEPFDDSMPELLKRHGVYTHLVSDHGHYWEDGGCTYHNRYSSWEQFRGQEGDQWKGKVEKPNPPPTLVSFTGTKRERFLQDQVNREYMESEADHPLYKTFQAGLEFIETNHNADQWFLQIEAFDPHEPFFSYKKYEDLYPHEYDGPMFDWPAYRKVEESEAEVQHIKCQYAALVSMCDYQLGRVLDMMDKYQLWEDTMLIVNTDHGFLLGEHGYWAKSYMPMYQEIVNIPLFIWHPTIKIHNEKRESLVQTIDLPATLLDYFNIEIPEDMQGRPLKDVMKDDIPVRNAALFGMHGGYLCCTDGRYVYMKAADEQENQPLFEYTLMPTHMMNFFTPEEIKTMKPHKPLKFTKGMPVMRFEVQSHYNTSHYGDLLFDILEDSKQENPMNHEELTERMKGILVSLMGAGDAPEEVYLRAGLCRKEMGTESGCRGVNKKI